MALEIFFPDDVHNAILAANEASAATAAVAVEAGGDVAILRAYRQGYRAALTTLALAFGVGPAAILGGVNTAETPTGPTLTLEEKGVLLDYGREERETKVENPVGAEPGGVSG